MLEKSLSYHPHSMGIEQPTRLKPQIKQRDQLWDWKLTWSWSMSQSPVMTIRFSILVSDRPPFNVWNKYTTAITWCLLFHDTVCMVAMVTCRDLTSMWANVFVQLSGGLSHKRAKSFDVINTQDMDVCVCIGASACTLVMCVVVVVQRDSEVIVWAVINTPGSPSPFPSNW